VLRARVRRRAATGLGSTHASAQLKPVGSRHVLAVRPAPAQPLRVAAAAGIGTHLPGLIYLVALKAIACERPAPVDAVLQVAISDALWFLVPLASLVLVVVRPDAALAHLDAATAWVRRHEHAILVSGSLVLGVYLVVKGTASLLI
jgi:hypothetical protein